MDWKTTLIETDCTWATREKFALLLMSFLLVDREVEREMVGSWRVRRGKTKALVKVFI